MPMVENPKKPIELRLHSWLNLVECLHHKDTHIHSMGNFWAAVQHIESQIGSYSEEEKARMEKNECPECVKDKRDIGTTAGEIAGTIDHVDDSQVDPPDLPNQTELLMGESTSMQIDRGDKEEDVSGNPPSSSNDWPLRK